MERSVPARSSSGLPGRGRTRESLADILERVLDKGIVIAGDIQINLLDIELLTIKLRLLVGFGRQGAGDGHRLVGVGHLAEQRLAPARERELRAAR